MTPYHLIRALIKLEKKKLVLIYYLIVINKFSNELLSGMLVLIAHESSDVSGKPARSALLPEH